MKPPLQDGRTSFAASSKKSLHRFQWLWPLMACILGWREIAERFDFPVQHDAEHVYLPAARSFLEQGWAYLLTSDSYRVVPLAYLWPALWNEDPFWIRLANAGLWAGCIYFLWHTARLLGGYRAGIIAVLLLAFHPELLRYFPTELTEPLFLFGLWGWIYSVARILIKGEATWGLVWLGGAMLTITLLSRPVLQLLAPACLALCLICLAYGKLRKPTTDFQWQPALAGLSWSLSLGMVLPLALVIKNGLVFGLWGLGTGSGAGLYLGTHPLFQGTEPWFLGFYYDANYLAALKTGSGDHLSLANDGVLRAAALWQIQSMTAPEAIAFFSRKLWWWLAYHPEPIDAFGSGLRKLRFFELLVLATSMASLLAMRFRRTKYSHLAHPPGTMTAPQWAFAGFLLAMFLGMLGQLIPILYNSRYSSALLDPWLVPLAAWALARLTAPIRLQGTFDKRGWSVEMAGPSGQSPWPALGMLGAILILTFGGFDLLRKHERIAVDPMHMGKTAIHLDISDRERADTHGMTPDGTRAWITTQSPAVLKIRIEPGDIERVTSAGLFNALWKTDLALSGDRECGRTDISYQAEDGRILQPFNKRPLRLPLETDGVFRSLVTHANEELRPREPGGLRIVLHCPVGTKVRWKNTQLLESIHFKDVAAHIQSPPETTR